jgi:hypothetical protein
MRRSGARRPAAAGERHIRAAAVHDSVSRTTPPTDGSAEATARSGTRSREGSFRTSSSPPWRTMAPQSMDERRCSGGRLHDFQLGCDVYGPGGSGRANGRRADTLDDGALRADFADRGGGLRSRAEGSPGGVRRRQGRKALSSFRGGLFGRPFCFFDHDPRRRNSGRGGIPLCSWAPVRDLGCRRLRGPKKLARTGALTPCSCFPGPRRRACDDSGRGGSRGPASLAPESAGRFWRQDSVGE